jgi:DNA-binding LacI/PurR family transcriptional regulator
VVDFPPHRNRYALALGSDMKDPGYPQFFKVLAEQAKRLDGKDHASIPIYYGVAHKAENPDIIRLSEDMERHRLAGVIYCGFVPDRFKLATIPQVLISSTQVDQFEAVSKLAMSTEHYVQKAVSYFASQGCKRLGVLCIVGWERKAHVHLVKACREAGILFEDHWLQAVGLPDPQTARRMTHLLMHADHRRRPDALLIADDNILPHALEGLDDAGVKAMQDVCVVAHANFPTSVESDRNIRRLGYDAREVIRSGIDLINEMHTNDNQSRSCPIEPYFEEELTL